MSTQETRQQQAFNYQEAFSRNNGFLNRLEQEKIRLSRVAIAGLGGTGGTQVQALARLGIGSFHLADFDRFELVNFNRQSGATLPNLGRKKTIVAQATLAAINPEAEVLLFSEGINEENIDAFLQGVDVVIDSLDFFAIDAKRLLYKRAKEKGIWVTTCAPIGFGCTILTFDPNGMSYEDYFGFKESTKEEEFFTLAYGSNPKPYALKYLDKEHLEINNKPLSSIGGAMFLAAGFIVAEVTKIITGKGKLSPVPSIFQIDALLNVQKRKSYPRGMKGPWMRFRKWIILKFIKPGKISRATKNNHEGF